MVVLAFCFAGACERPQDRNMPLVFDPSSEPAVRGTLKTMAADTPDQFRLVAASDEYFEGMTFFAYQVPIVTDDSGEAIGADKLTDGTTVDVWLLGGCGESFPVQCTVMKLRVVDEQTG